MRSSTFFADTRAKDLGHRFLHGAYCCSGSLVGVNRDANATLLKFPQRNVVIQRRHYYQWLLALPNGNKLLNLRELLGVDQNGVSAGLGEGVGEFDRGTKPKAPDERFEPSDDDEVRITLGCFGGPIFPTISSSGASPRWLSWYKLQRFGNRLSSMQTPATPAASNSVTIRMTLTALPNPALQSASTGVLTALAMYRTTSKTSDIAKRSASGMH